MLALGVSVRPTDKLGAAVVVCLLALVRPAAGQVGIWTSHGPPGGNMYCLAQDPSNAAILYAGTGQGVYKSDDGGATWHQESPDLAGYGVFQLAVDPNSPERVVAATTKGLYRRERDASDAPRWVQKKLVGFSSVVASRDGPGGPTVFVAAPAASGGSSERVKVADDLTNPQAGSSRSAIAGTGAPALPEA